MTRSALSIVTLAVATALLAVSAHAQTRAPAAQPPQAQAVPQPPEKCLRALDGKCTNPSLVEAARLRANVIPAVRVSYFGTPAGTIGGNFIPFERLFQDDQVRFGLSTSVVVTPCCVTRSK